MRANTYYTLGIVLIVLLLGCENDDAPATPGVDATSPAAVQDLRVTRISPSSVMLTWTAPGDDGTTGQACEYDIRYTISPSPPPNTDTWTSLPRLLNAPKPQKPGSAEMLLVEHLRSEDYYTFGLRTADEVPNYSFITNSAQTSTGQWDKLAWCHPTSGLHWVLCNVQNNWDPLLFVGGPFASLFYQHIGGQLDSLDANHIAKWDGTTWSSVGGGIDGEVRAMINWPNDNHVTTSYLVVGGDLRSAGDTPVNNIVQWDGATWHRMAEGLNGPVLALCEYNGDLIAGGDFTVAGRDSTNHVARWDGHTWMPFGRGLQGRVTALAVYNSKLIAGGRFYIEDTSPVQGVALWTGDTWEAIGIDATIAIVEDLLVYEDELVVTGYRLGVDDAGVLGWDGQTWRRIGPVFEAGCAALFDQSLVIGSSAWGSSEIVWWDGAVWNPLGVLHGVKEIRAYRGDLVACSWDGIQIWRGWWSLARQ